MRKSGFTLIELIVVISIISLLTIVGFVNFKTFSTDQVVIKAAGQVQSLLRLAQSNATSSTTCNGLGVKSWQITFTSNSSNIYLKCKNEENPNFGSRTYTLENAEVSTIAGSNSSCTSSSTQITFEAGAGKVSFIDPANACISTANSLAVTVRNKSQTSSTKTITVSKGGAVDVQ